MPAGGVGQIDIGVEHQTDVASRPARTADRVRVGTIRAVHRTVWWMKTKGDRFINQLIMLSELAVKRVLDNLEMPR